MTKLDEKKIAGASYILSFYNEIQALTDTYSNYLNLMLELQHKYPGSSVEKAEEQEKQIINNWLQTVRLHAHKSYIQYQSLLPHLKMTKDKTIDEKYKEIANKFVIDRDKLKDFVITMNNILVEGVIQEILLSNREALNEIVSNK